jgi:polar amino acid transport system permease protein
MRTFGTPEFLFLLGALRWTILLTAIAFSVGIVGGLLVAVARTSPLRWLRWLSAAYIQVFQGTPVLMQLFVVYYGLAVLFGLRIDAWSAIVIAFTLYASAFLGEIWRGFIQALPEGQWMAARSLALPWHLQMRLVILPQALRHSIPATVGFLVQLIKSTSVASIIGFVELTRAGQLMTNVTFQPLVVYPVVALLYFMMCWPLSLFGLHLERSRSRNKTDKVQTAVALTTPGQG